MVPLTDNLDVPNLNLMKQIHQERYTMLTVHTFSRELYTLMYTVFYVAKLLQNSDLAALVEILVVYQSGRLFCSDWADSLKSAWFSPVWLKSVACHNRQLSRSEEDLSFTGSVRRHSWQTWPIRCVVHFAQIKVSKLLVHRIFTSLAGFHVNEEHRMSQFHVGPVCFHNEMQR